MRKFLIVAMALVTLCSCAAASTKVPDSEPDFETIAPSSDSKSEGSESDTVKITDADKADPDSTMPDESFIGVWSSDEAKTNQILIYEITKVSVKFNTGVNGLFGFDATAMVSGDEIIFGDGISPGYSGPEGVRGKLKFDENSITVTYDSFGTLPDAEFYPTEYTFTIKDENSDAIISQHKENLPG